MRAWTAVVGVALGVERVITLVEVLLLRAYRLLISPLYGQVCRYYPSCSAYALQAVQTHGAVRGTWLAGRRLVRCHPWAAGGYDPVPPRGQRHGRDDGGPGAPGQITTPVDPAAHVHPVVGGR